MVTSEQCWASPGTPWQLGPWLGNLPVTQITGLSVELKTNLCISLSSQMAKSCLACLTCPGNAQPSNCSFKCPLPVPCALCSWCFDHEVFQLPFAAANEVKC
mmetsp:Transcript_41211/g.95777  ORF Transcript_41211/g.95777 Transcript_41211/m.95777 type:complete len:102 (-) Transcript_41211:14-319(-)